MGVTLGAARKVVFFCYTSEIFCLSCRIYEHSIMSFLRPATFLTQNNDYTQCYDQSIELFEKSTKKLLKFIQAEFEVHVSIFFLQSLIRVYPLEIASDEYTHHV